MSSCTAEGRLDGLRRYSGTEREEKVDRAELDEFVPACPAPARALRDDPISDTITRENVLAPTAMDLHDQRQGPLSVRHGDVRADRQPRPAQAPTAPRSPSTLDHAARLQIGSRRKLRAWGLDAFGRLEHRHREHRRARQRPGRPHRLRLAAARAPLPALLRRPGHQLVLLRRRRRLRDGAVQGNPPGESRCGVERESLVGGVLNLDLFVGYEFLRASSVHFFGQLRRAPRLRGETENDSGGIDTWMPGPTAGIGVIF